MSVDSPRALSAFQAQAFAAGVSKALSGKHFSICDIDNLAELQGITLGGADYTALRCLHCMDWGDMTPLLRQAVRQQVCDLLHIPIDVVDVEARPSSPPVPTAPTPIEQVPYHLSPNAPQLAAAREYGFRLATRKPFHFPFWRRGNATIQGILAAMLIAAVMAGLGQHLDQHRPSTQAAYQAPPIEAGEIARLEADARHRCAATHGHNGGVIHLADGAIVCTEKHGRSPRNQITTLLRVER